MPRRQLLGPLGEHPLHTRRFPAPVPALPPDDQQRPVPHRQILDPHLPHVIRLAAGQHPAPRAGVLGGDLHHHDPPHPQRRPLNRHHPEPRQVEQQRRSVTHRWPPARSTEDIDQRGRPPPHHRVTTRCRSPSAVKSLIDLANEGWAFAATVLTIAASVGSIFVALYPNVLVSSTNPAFNLTVSNSSSGAYALKVMTV